MADVEVFVPEDQAVDGGLLPDYRRLTRLYCMNGGHHLQILADGSVQGQRDDGEAHSKTAVRTLHPAVLKLKAVDRGVVVIEGTEAGRYLAMSDEGRLYGSPTLTDECFFLEKLEENHYNTYLSQKHQDKSCCSSPASEDELSRHTHSHTST
ncbi:putative fibroblast growth factor 1 isoform X2 [Acanthopagrus latus]|uniref:putative fibroblast growth factor 1 isoform X2 n=1 Tax=Acanthopagrus latus TaxID=8177 RepID=UPI00187C28B4|nr:putative fibroblast growth factor 1 isoform X2 [Acanthopagrus latus]